MTKPTSKKKKDGDCRCIESLYYYFGLARKNCSAIIEKELEDQIKTEAVERGLLRAYKFYWHKAKTK